MPNTYSTDVLIGVVAGLPAPNPALLDRYYTQTSQDESEEIHFDLIDSKRRIAPFVHPLVEGKVVEGLGFHTNTFKPAYVKDKRVFDPSKPLKRAVGEQIGGSLSPLQRRDVYLAQSMQDQVEMLARRQEVMASEEIRTGKVTVVGEGYPTALVDFQRDATLSPAALTSTARWGQSAAAITANLKTWSKLVRKKSGRNPNDVIMGEDAFDAFSSDATVKAELDNRRINGSQLDLSGPVEEGLTFHGVFRGKNIWSYSGTYVDPIDDTEKEIWPLGDVALVSVGIEGVRCYGAIRDGKAGFRAMAYFPKMWEKDDPAVEYLMLQSAPLPVPMQPNATLGVTVL